MIINSAQYNMQKMAAAEMKRTSMNHPAQINNNGGSAYEIHENQHPMLGHLANDIQNDVQIQKCHCHNKNTIDVWVEVSASIEDNCQVV